LLIEKLKMPEPNKFGWEAVRRLIHNLGSDMQAARKESLSAFALEAERIAVLHMQRQDLGWETLSPQYLAQKIRRGESELTLIASSTYVQSITSWTDGEKAYAGVKRSAVDDDGKVLANIAKIHEFGGGSVPARPLWQPTFDKAVTWHKRNNTPEMHLMRRLKAYGI
jgi:hypothetical protein